MTQDEYDAAYAAARKSYASMSLETYKKLKQVYIDASIRVQEAIKAAEVAGNSQITIASLQNINEQLQIAANQIQGVISEETISLMENGALKGSSINVEFLKDALDKVDGLPFNIEGIKNAYVAVNQLVVESTLNRLFSDGYSFSERIIKAGEYYQEQVKLIIAQGQALARSTVEIAKDIKTYIKGDKLELANRYGILSREDVDNFRKGKLNHIDWKEYEKAKIAEYGAEKGKLIVEQTKAFMKRIGNTVDWRALRIARSELYMSLQDAAKEQGRTNPACNGTYDWVLEGGRQDWGCTCPEYARNGPYEYNLIPGYPHSNCRCSVRPNLRDVRDFEADLKKWNNGEAVPYLDEWYNTIYKSYQ